MVSEVTPALQKRNREEKKGGGFHILCIYYAIIISSDIFLTYILFVSTLSLSHFLSLSLTLLSSLSSIEIVVTLLSVEGSAGSEAFLAVACTTTIIIPPSNNPFGVFSFSTPSSLTTSKGSASYSLTILRSAGSFGSVTLWFNAIDNATRGNDYDIPSPSVTFAPGQLSADLTVNILSNSIPEELVSIVVDCRSVSPVVVPNGGAPIVFVPSSVFTITILPSNNVYGMFQIAPLLNTTVAPGPDPVVTLNVTRSIGSGGRVRVSFGAGNSTAAAGLNYAFLQGSQSISTSTSYVDFDAGQTT